jgi:hypothetical protein
MSRKLLLLLHVALLLALLGPGHAVARPGLDLGDEPGMPAALFAPAPVPVAASDPNPDSVAAEPTLLTDTILRLPVEEPGAADPYGPLMPARGGALVISPTRLGVPLSFHTPAQAKDETASGRFESGAQLIASFEVTLLGVTMMMPESFTGWSENFISDGAGHLRRAYTQPPVWDDDLWVHNYVGHPYGGSLYYNTVRCRGGGVFESFLFSTSMSMMWEYGFEAVAERPSIQDLFITPILGSLLGELTHHMAVRMKADGCSGLEKLAIAVLNPMDALLTGFGSFAPQPPGSVARASLAETTASR